MAVVTALETDRLRIRRLDASDAGFIVRLMNEPSWLQYIGDKGVRSLRHAQRYIRKGPMEMYRRLGFGLCLVEPRGGGEPIGICGLIKRDTLADVDLGFAFFPQYWGRGYAFESASAVMSYGRDVLGLRRIVAVTTPDNHRSIRLLAKLGFRFEELVRLQPDGDELGLYAFGGAKEE